MAYYNGRNPQPPVFNLSGNNVRNPYYPRATGVPRTSGAYVNRGLVPRASGAYVNRGYYGAQTPVPRASYGPRQQVAPTQPQVAPTQPRRNLMICLLISIIGFVLFLLVIGAVLAVVFGTGSSGTTDQRTTRAPIPTFAPQPTLAPQPQPTQAPQPQPTQAPQPQPTQAPQPQPTQAPQPQTTQAPQTTARTFVEGDIFETGICGTQPVLDTRIVGGQNAALGHHPWIGSFQASSDHQCGSTLINSRWAVTAAHCVVGVDQIPDSVTFGFTDLTNTGSTSQATGISQIITHPSYDTNSDNQEFDISLLRLSVEIDFTNYVRPLCLATNEQETSVYHNCKAAGWGALIEYDSNTQDAPMYPDDLQEVILPLISSSDCQAIDNTATSNIICAAGTPQGGTDTCQADSGGPLACQSTADDSWHLVGIVSTGEGCGLPNIPGFYTRVSQFITWIQANVN